MLWTKGERRYARARFFYYMILLHWNLVHVTAQPLLKSSQCEVWGVLCCSIWHWPLTYKHHLSHCTPFDRRHSRSEVWARLNQGENRNAPDERSRTDRSLVAGRAGPILCGVVSTVCSNDFQAPLSQIGPFQVVKICVCDPNNYSVMYILYHQCLRWFANVRGKSVLN